VTLQLRKLTALLSLAIASTILALSLGLWERSNILLNNLRDVVGRHTWVIKPINEEGDMPPRFLAREIVINSYSRCQAFKG
jgi:hypothetical protein